MRDTWLMLIVVWLMLLYAHFSEGSERLIAGIGALVLATGNLFLAIMELVEKFRPGPSDPA